MSRPTAAQVAQPSLSSSVSRTLTSSTANFTITLTNNADTAGANLVMESGIIAASAVASAGSGCTLVVAGGGEQRRIRCQFGIGTRGATAQFTPSLNRPTSGNLTVAFTLSAADGSSVGQSFSITAPAPTPPPRPSLSSSVNRTLTSDTANFAITLTNNADTAGANLVMESGIIAASAVASAGNGCTLVVAGGGEQRRIRCQFGIGTRGATAQFNPSLNRPASGNLTVSFTLSAADGSSVGQSFSVTAPAVAPPSGPSLSSSVNRTLTSDTANFAITLTNNADTAGANLVMESGIIAASAVASAGNGCTLVVAGGGEQRRIRCEFGIGTRGATAQFAPSLNRPASGNLTVSFTLSAADGSSIGQSFSVTAPPTTPPAGPSLSASVNRTLTSTTANFTITLTNNADIAGANLVMESGVVAASAVASVGNGCTLVAAGGGEQRRIRCEFGIGTRGATAQFTPSLNRPPTGDLTLAFTLQSAAGDSVGDTFSITAPSLGLTGPSLAGNAEIAFSGSRASVLLFVTNTSDFAGSGLLLTSNPVPVRSVIQAPECDLIDEAGNVLPPDTQVVEARLRCGFVLGAGSTRQFSLVFQRPAAGGGRLPISFTPTDADGDPLGVSFGTVITPVPTTPVDNEASNLINNPNTISVADPVQVATGNLTDAKLDLRLGRNLYAMDLVRSYNSLTIGYPGLDDPPLGDGWRLSHQINTSTDADGVVGVLLGSGRQVRFEPLEGGGYTRPDGFSGRLIDAAEGNEVIEFFDGSRWTFTDGRISEMSSLHHGTVEILYNDDNSIVSIRSSIGPEYRIDYNEQKLISKITGTSTGADTREVSYGYDDDGHLRTVTNANGETSTYETDGIGRITKMIDATGVETVTNTYDDEGRVANQTTAAGEFSEFDYQADATVLTVTGAPRPGGATRVDVYTYARGDKGYLATLVDPLGQRVTFERNSFGEPTGVLDRRANSSDDAQDGEVEREFDEFGNVTSVTSAGIGTWRYEYSYTATSANGQTLPLHRLTTVTAPNGGVTTYRYDGINATPTEIAGPEGHSITNVIEDGLIVATTDADGVTNRMTYDETKRLSSVTDGVGNTTSFRYDAIGRMTEMVDPTGNTTTMSYDGVGRLLSSTDRSNATRSRIYDDAGRLTTFVDALDALPGVTSRVEMNHGPDGQLSSVVDQRSNETSFDHNDFGQRTSLTRPGGATWQYDFAELGQLVSTTDPVRAAATFNLGYDVEGLVDEITDPDQASISTVYDDAERPVTTTDRNGIITSFTYAENSGGQLLSQTVADGTPDEITISYDYDDAFRVTAVRGPREGDANSFAYTDAGRLHSVTDAKGNAVTYHYDAAGRVGSVILPGDRAVRYEYDADSRVIAVTSPEGLRYRTAYDNSGRITKLTSPAGVSTALNYDLNGGVSATRLGEDPAATFSFDAMVLNDAIDPNGGGELYEYDGRTNLVRWVDQNGNPTAFEYNLADEQTRSVDPLGRATSMTYDAHGRLETVADASQRSSTRSFDSGGRVTALSFADGSQQRFAYDALGRIVAIQDVDAAGKIVGTVSSEYDKAGNLLKFTEADGDTVSYEWDQVGNRTKLIYPDGTSVVYAYDELNRLTSAEHSVHGKTRYRWDDDSRLTQIKFPNGSRRVLRYEGEQLTRFIDGHRMWKLDYDQSGRLIDISGAEDWEFDYDGAGQLTEASRGKRFWNYRYDAVGNVVEAARGWFRSRGYDHRAHSSTKPKTPTRSLKKQWEATFTVDAANQVESSTVADEGRHYSSTFSFDNAGRLTGESRSNGQELSYVYDIRGRLGSVTLTSPGKNSKKGPEVITWARTYSPDGLLAAVTRTSESQTGRRHGGKHGDKGGPKTTEQTWLLTWDRTQFNPQPLGWTDADSGRSVALVHGVGPALSITQQNKNKGRDYQTDYEYGYDHRGRNRAKVSVIRRNAFGDIIGSPVSVARSFDPHGRYNGDGDDFGLGYRGELHVGPTIYLKSRDLDPDQLRFLTPDPLSAPPGSAVTSRYAYAANDPINFEDPRGLSPSNADVTDSEDLGLDLRHAFNLAQARGRLEGNYAYVTVPFEVFFANPEGRYSVSYAMEMQTSGHQAATGNFGDLMAQELITLKLADGTLVPVNDPDYANILVASSCLSAAEDHKGVSGCVAYSTGILEETIGDPHSPRWEIIVTEGVTGYADRIFGQIADAPGAARPSTRGAADLPPTPGTSNGTLDDLGRLSCRSFSADTTVLMADGTTKPISEIAVGDLVYAADPQSGETAPQAVLRTLPHVDQLLVLETSAGGVWTTEDHLYWNATDGKWQESQHLSPGDALLSATGATVLAQGLDWQTARVDLAYDLDVAGFDTFFVSVGDDSALVHNIECPWQLKTDANFGNQVLDGQLPQTGQLSQLKPGQLRDLRSDLATSIANRQRNLWDGTFPVGTEQFRRHAARVDLEVGLLDRVDDLLG
ncbi:MAG: polymorphic toxin-type HINT domain-containing protein [Acidimicrobiales bacterium]